MTWFAQETDHTCGPAALRSALAALGRAVPDEAWLAQRLGTDRDGTRPWRMVQGALAIGLRASCGTGTGLADLRRALDQGRVPVVLCRLADEEVDHYAVVTSASRREVVLTDPWRGARHRMATDGFLMDWRAWEDGPDRWALVAS